MKRRHTVNCIYVVVFVLLILEVFMLPVILTRVSDTATKEDKYTVVYKDKELICNCGSKLTDEGAILLNFFDECNKTTKSGRDETITVDYDKSFKSGKGVDKNIGKVIAPGGEKVSVITIKNSENCPLKYDAWLFNGSTSDQLPITVDMTSDGEIAVPEEDMKKEFPAYTQSSIDYIKGIVPPGKSQEIEVVWKWDYSSGESQDEIDTYLGNRASENIADKITIGFKILAETSGKPVTLQNIDTDNRPKLALYVLFMIISLFVLLHVLFEKDEEDEEIVKYSFKNH